ncbi:MAG: phosphoglucosamine mutase [Holosporales bacterium]|jgi:phosphoglucosamine mutase|nr:phosphoglucosamine mutase [Holosporales bacterium]
MKRLFGTDGIRGQANAWPMTPDVIVQVGRAVAIYFQKNSASSRKRKSIYTGVSNECGQETEKSREFALTKSPQLFCEGVDEVRPLPHKHFNPYVDHANHQFTVVIGKDTRLSGYMIESALVSGLVSEGANVIMLGPVPTPAIAMLARSLRADVGIMISASHNPYFDNGIKFFDEDGVKFSSEVEEEIEGLIERLMENRAESPSTGEYGAGNGCEYDAGNGAAKGGRQKSDSSANATKECGKSIRLDDAAGRYVEFAKSTFPKKYDLSEVKVVLDCANGAAYKVAPRIFWELGATVIPLGDAPNGRNINDHCGALYPKPMQECLSAVGADVGIALDGDADRLLLTTKIGQIINGDQILALIAKNWAGFSQNVEGLRRLTNGVVSTCMSNIGLKKYLKSLNIEHFEAKVGDKNVVDLMRKTQSNLGGEESGHIILSDYTTTGDGIIAALQVLGIAREQGVGLDDLFPLYVPCPQVTKNFAINASITGSFIKDLQDEIMQQVQGDGCVVIRKSGTEPLLRVMIQDEDMQNIERIFDEIVMPKVNEKLSACKIPIS